MRPLKAPAGTARLPLLGQCMPVLAGLCALLVSSAWCEPVARGLVRAPIAPSAAPSEMDPHFEAASGQALRLPRYSLATTPVYYAPLRGGDPFTDKLQHRILLREMGGAGVLTVYLARCSAARCPLPPGAGEIDVVPDTATLVYGPPAMRIERRFEQLVQTPDGLRARLDLVDAAVLEEVRSALHDPASKPSIALTSTVHAALAVEAPEVERLARDMHYDLGRAPRALDQALRAEDDACAIWRTYPHGTLHSGERYIAGRCGQDAEIREKLQRLATLRTKFPDPYFELADIRATNLVQPDIPHFDGQDFRDVVSESNPPGYFLRTVVYGDIRFNYYQEVWRPEVFRYLPDAFKFAVRNEIPDLEIVYLVGKGSPVPTSGFRARINFGATPWADPHRLAVAACALRDFVEDDKVAPDLRPLAGLARPEMDPDFGACDFTERELPFDKAFTGSCVLTMPQFQDFFDRIYSDQPAFQASLTTGTTATAPRPIPFEPRMADLSGTVLTYSARRATISNASGYPVVVPGTGLRAWVKSTCRPVQLVPSTPGDGELRIEGGDEVAVAQRELQAALPAGSVGTAPARAAPADLRVAGSGPDVVPDSNPVTVLMDVHGIVRALTHPPALAARQLTVKAAGWPRNARTIVVSFLAGPAAVLTEQSPTATVELYAPGPFKYRVDIVRDEVSSQGWQQFNGELLLVP